jgi:hypothetical protein
MRKYACVSGDSLGGGGKPWPDVFVNIETQNAKETTMNEIEFETMLYELLQDDESAPEIARVQTFEEAGLLTNNRGVVVHTAEGITFQVTIVKSR